MTDPVVYLWHGEDESALREEIAKLNASLGDATTADMNTTRLEAPSLTLDSLTTAAKASPFLAPRRLVIARGTVKTFQTQEQKTRLTSLLDELPETTALVIAENPGLDEKNWLVKWAKAAGGRAQVRTFQLPEGAQFASWIRERAKARGGEFQPQAAAALAQRIGGDKFAAEAEIEKLLAFANYARPVTAEDVGEISLSLGEHGDFFGLIDALGSGNGSRAMKELRSLMEERELIVLYFSLVGHFRALLQAREYLDRKQTEAQLASAMNVKPFRAQKLMSQARRFPKGGLEQIYKRLLDMDEKVKSGEMDYELAMETLVAGLSVPAV
jgi:DNA polymerase-3 subunit delta